MSQSALSMPTNVANGGGRPKRGPKRDYNKLLSEREGEMGPWTEAHWEPEKGMRAAEQFPADAPEESAAVRADATVRPSARKQPRKSKPAGARATAVLPSLPSAPPPIAPSPCWAGHALTEAFASAGLREEGVLEDPSALASLQRLDEELRFVERIFDGGPRHGPVSPSGSVPSKPSPRVGGAVGGATAAALPRVASDASLAQYTQPASPRSGPGSVDGEGTAGQHRGAALPPSPEGEGEEEEEEELVQREAQWLLTSAPFHAPAAAEPACSASSAARAPPPPPSFQLPRLPETALQVPGAALQMPRLPEAVRVRRATLAPRPDPPASHARAPRAHHSQPAGLRCTGLRAAAAVGDAPKLSVLRGGAHEVGARRRGGRDCRGVHARRRRRCGRWRRGRRGGRGGGGRWR